MRWLFAYALAAIVFISTAGIQPAHSAAPVPVTFGTSWDGPGTGLQSIVDAYLGAPGVIDVHADFVGARAGDLDPWFWVGASCPALLITEIAGNANTNSLGWYRETFTMPILDGVDDGIVFSGAQGGGDAAIVVFPAGVTKFGFYLDTHQRVSTPSGQQSQVFFTNRFLNDVGPAGFTATHAPFDGDVQAIVFDVSQWKGPNTWLVCFEDLDSGLPVRPCCSGSDNDFNDFVFQVEALGATPTQALTFGGLKARYR